MNIKQIREYDPDVIVVLGGGVKHDNPEYGGESMPSSGTLGRLRYASWIAKKIGCAVIVSGGYGETPQQSEAATMAASLLDEDDDDEVAAVACSGGGAAVAPRRCATVVMAVRSFFFSRSMSCGVAERSEGFDLKLRFCSSRCGCG